LGLLPTGRKEPIAEEFHPIAKSAGLVLRLALFEMILSLFNLGKPRPLGGVKVIWLCLKNAFEIAVAKP